MGASAAATGHEPTKCGALLRDGSGRHCGKPAGWGTDHLGIGTCRLHLGATGTHKVAARRTKAREAVLAFNLSREIEPEEALLQELYRTQGLVETLNGYVHGRDDEWLASGDGRYFTGLLNDNRRHLKDVAKSCLDSKLDERRVRLNEAQATLLGEAMTGLLVEAGLRDHPKAMEWIHRQLSIAAGKMPVIEGMATEGSGH